MALTDAELEELPEWAQKAIENGIPLMRSHTGEWVVGWPQRYIKPGILRGS